MAAEPSPPLCFSCKDQHAITHLCICGLYYCEKCTDSKIHKIVCSDSFHIKVRNVIHTIERDKSITINGGNGMSCATLIIKRCIGSTLETFKTS